MLALPPRQEPRWPVARDGVHPGRLAAVLAALTGALLASAAAIPAASAGIVVPGPGGQYGPAGVMPVPRTGMRVITAGGMASWQVALIAAGAAAVAATAAVYLDRALTGRQAGLVSAARRWYLAWAGYRPAVDPACPAAHTPDTSLLPAGPASSTADIVEFGRSLTR